MDATDKPELEILQFVPFKSFVNPTFWHKLAEIKIDFDKLSDAPKNIYGYYTNCNSKSCLLEIDYSAFNRDFTPPKSNFTFNGTLYNKNTIEEFKECNKVQLLQEEGNKFIEDVKSGRILDDPRLLSRFLILSFADLKVHKYYYWFAFPCPISPTIHIPIGHQATKLTDSSALCERFKNIYEGISDNKDSAYFILKADKTSLKHYALRDLISAKNSVDNFATESDFNKLFFCFADPSEFAKPSWLLRIFVSFLYLACPALRGKTLQFVGIRAEKGDYGNSLIWSIQLPETEAELKFVGWEANHNGKMGPRMASMADSMDPAKLAENSVNLNLKLMKWRILPNLDLDILGHQKCLLFGAGTLGCAVARNLLSWGFNAITLIDSGKVSFSNPVRQSLYKHEDAISGKKMKATTAAERIKEINPNAAAEGHILEIPMPSHPVGDSMRQNVLSNLKTIEELVKSHDVIFLLTDSRESRWLPTVLGAVYQKTVINAALGFDSFLVMRHGSTKKNKDESKSVDFGDLKQISGAELGCYFCNDVTAPGDSLKDRTLDQQCTVTRPGVSNIASSYAVELLVSLLQHPEKDLAPAYFSNTGNNKTSIPEGLLGVIPHSIRGMLCNFANILPATSKFTQCIACSEVVLNEYKTNGFEFLFKVFESAKYLEDLTGISSYEDLENEIIECDDSDFE